jgi:hypothetical protein
MLSNLVQVLKSQHSDAKVYSILYDGRSGSVFLQSLLDNHPRIITFPATVLMGGLTGKHINEFLMDGGPDNWGQFTEKFILSYPTLFDSRSDSSGMRLNELGKARDEYISISPEKFSDAMKFVSNEIQFTKRNAFLAIHLVWEYVRKETIDDNPIILYAMHTPEDSMKVVMELFPEMKVLLSTREPKSTLASYYYHHIKRYEFEGRAINFWDDENSLSYPFRTLEYFINSYFIIDKYVDYESIRVVRLEDLHSKPKETMLRVANWMGIDYKDCLLESTFGGLLHWGDITIEYKTGPSYSELEFDWRRSYYWSDVLILETIFSHRYENYGYRKEMQNSEELNSDEKIINLLLDSFPMKWEVQALALNKSINEYLIYSLIKNEMTKPSIYNFFIKLMKSISLKKISKKANRKNMLEESQLLMFLGLIKKRQVLIKKYQNQSRLEKRFKLI